MGIAELADLADLRGDNRNFFEKEKFR